MALKYRCFLDGVEYDEPTNLADIEMSIIRDDDLHGIGFEASTISLEFTGAAYDYLYSLKESQGLKATPVFRMETNCDDDSDIWETVVEGKLNMTQFKRACGNGCTVSLPVESPTCETVLKNRYDQAVNMDNPLSFGGMALPPYFNLGVNMSLPTKELDYLSYGIVEATGDVEPIEFADPGGGDGVVWVRPEFTNTVASNIQDTTLTGGTNVGVHNAESGFFSLITPQVLFNEPRVQCFGQTFKVNGRLKGTFSLPGTSETTLSFKLHRGEIHPELALNDPLHDVRYLYNVGPFTNPINEPFDWTFAEYEWTPENNGSDSMLLMISVFQKEGNTFDGNFTFDSDTFFKCETLKSCPPTDTKAYLIHETLSRATEAITDLCVRVKSSYYGRTDSEPFDFPVDGCGGLRFLTSGLKIRNADNATFSPSLQDLIEGLQAIDNIGMGIEMDPDRPGYLLLRVEDLDFFYQDQEIMRCELISEGQEAIDITKSFSVINVGYKKWETQANFGLDEFNSTREYRTALTAISATLDITSGIVAGEYPIEITREQQYVETSDADTTYDNEMFIICLRRIIAAGYPYGEMVVEQGNIDTPENIFSPGSIYNYGISPLRNLMRWFRSIAACYPNILDSDNRLYFNAGTGNLLAKGELSELYGGTCRLEKVPIQENQDINPQIFLDPAKAVPLWKNETFTYDYPLSLKEYKVIKANPYGYVSYQCGNGPWQKGWIKELSYKPIDGMATFTLKRKWS